MSVLETRGLKFGCGTLLILGLDSLRVCMNGRVLTGEIKGSSTWEELRLVLGAAIRLLALL